jgi:hypothetical protein
LSERAQKSRAIGIVVSFARRLARSLTMAMRVAISALAGSGYDASAASAASAAARLGTGPASEKAQNSRAARAIDSLVALRVCGDRSLAPPGAAGIVAQRIGLLD